MNNGKQPAYPASSEEINLGYFKGLTKREYYAGVAMQGILANMAQSDIIKVNDYGIDGNKIAQNALHCADELLKQLEAK